MIEALALLSRYEREKISIEWYGDGMDTNNLDDSILSILKKIKQYRLNNVISFYPATKDILNKIQQSDAVGLFSFYEGLPNAICEAMACGKLVVCSAVSDIPELISYERRVLCNPQDPKTIKEAISYLANLPVDSLKEMGEMNLRIAYKNFEKEAIINQYLNLFES